MTPSRRRPAGPRIYTRGGDAGETGLIGGRRVPKDHPRVEAYGAVDELNAHLGAARAAARRGEMAALLGEIQHRLFDLGAELATPGSQAAPAGVRAEDVAALERAIDRYQERLPPLRAFILPGGTSLAAALHVARAVCRRAERRVVTLSRAEPVRPEVLQYLNRLSDLLFVLARAANRAARRPDVVWRKRPSPEPGG